MRRFAQIGIVNIFVVLGMLSTAKADPKTINIPWAGADVMVGEGSSGHARVYIRRPSDNLCTYVTIGYLTTPWYDYVTINGTSSAERIIMYSLDRLYSSVESEATPVFLNLPFSDTLYCSNLGWVSVGDMPDGYDVRINGAGGDDFLVGASSYGTISGGDGNDFIALAYDSFTYDEPDGNGGDDHIVNLLVASGYSDIRGDSGADCLVDAEGSNTLDCGSSTDTHFGDD